MRLGLSELARHTIPTHLDDPERWFFWTPDEATRRVFVVDMLVEHRQEAADAFDMARRVSCRARRAD